MEYLLLLNVVLLMVLAFFLLRRVKRGTKLTGTGYFYLAAAVLVGTSLVIMTLIKNGQG